MQTSQEHFTTIVYAKLGGQTECIMGNWKIENSEINARFLLKEDGNLYFLLHNNSVHTRYTYR